MLEFYKLKFRATYVEIKKKVRTSYFLNLERQRNIRNYLPTSIPRQKDKPYIETRTPDYLQGVSLKGYQLSYVGSWCGFYYTR